MIRTGPKMSPYTIRKTLIVAAVMAAIIPPCLGWKCRDQASRRRGGKAVLWHGEGHLLVQHRQEDGFDLLN